MHRYREITFSILGTVFIFGSFWFIILSLFGFATHPLNAIHKFGELGEWAINIAMLVAGIGLWILAEGGEN